jgi:hypothetical protein
MMESMKLKSKSVQNSWKLNTYRKLMKLNTMYVKISVQNEGDNCDSYCVWIITKHVLGDGE